MQGFLAMSKKTKVAEEELEFDDELFDDDDDSEEEDEDFEEEPDEKTKVFSSQQVFARRSLG